MSCCYLQASAISHTPRTLRPAFCLLHLPCLDAAVCVNVAPRPTDPPFPPHRSKKPPVSRLSSSSTILPIHRGAASASPALSQRIRRITNASRFPFSITFMFQDWDPRQYVKCPPPLISISSTQIAYSFSHSSLKHSSNSQSPSTQIALSQTHRSVNTANASSHRARAGRKTMYLAAWRKLAGAPRRCRARRRFPQSLESCWWGRMRVFEGDLGFAGRRMIFGATWKRVRGF